MKHTSIQSTSVSATLAGFAAWFTAKRVIPLLAPILCAGALHAFTGSYVANSNPGCFSASVTMSYGRTHTEYSGPWWDGNTLRQCGKKIYVNEWTHVHKVDAGNHFLNEKDWPIMDWEIAIANINNGSGQAWAELN